jgi:hypothetical protein
VLGEVTETVYTVDEDAEGDDTVRVSDPFFDAGSAMY